jgi:F-type H+-transporting ATPase subunit gamma
MASGRTIKNRIKSTKNIRQITKAMEAVSAVKMRRSQMLALSARPYALAALEILKGVTGASTEAISSSYMETRDVKTSCLAVITSDKGLAGSFNSNVLKRAEQILKDKSKDYTIVTIGKKARDYFYRRNYHISAEFIGAGDYGSIDETKYISDFLDGLFTEKKCDEVIIVYTNFLSALKQEVIVRKILPFSFETITNVVMSILPDRGRFANMPEAIGSTMSESRDFIFEPSPASVLEEILPELLKVEIFHSILEANASEHSSRMVAMKSASENANELVQELNLAYNKNRQALITKELAEITGGREALEA